MSELVQSVMDQTQLVDWSQYATAYGDADQVPKWLVKLASAETVVAKKASHELWCSLCHQHAYVSSAALPSYPILLSILRSTDDLIAIEILDILWGFAKCSAVRFFGSPQKHEWVVGLRNRLKEDQIYFEELSKNPNEEIRVFASLIVEDLAAD